MPLLSVSALLGFVVLILTGCAGQQETREPAAIKTPVQVMQEKQGFVLKERNEEFQRYAFRDQGEFLISNRGFKNRPQAEGFCSVREGFELSDSGLPNLLAKDISAFGDLKKSNAVGQRVLGRNRSGLVFWVKGNNIDQEARIGNNFDTVLEIYDNCSGSQCTGTNRLSKINERLLNLRGKSKMPQAVCVSAKLKRKL